MMRENGKATATVQALVEAIAGVSAGVNLAEVAAACGADPLALGRVRNRMDKIPFAAAAAMAAAGGHALVCGVARIETGPVEATPMREVVEGVARAQGRRAAAARTARTVHAVSVYAMARHLGIGRKVVDVMEDAGTAPFLHSVVEHLARYGLAVGLVPATGAGAAAAEALTAARHSLPVQPVAGDADVEAASPSAFSLALEALGSARGASTRMSGALGTAGRHGYRVAVLTSADAEAANRDVAGYAAKGFKRPRDGGHGPVGAEVAAARLGEALRRVREAGDPRIKATARAVGVDYRSINEIEGRTGNVRASYLADYLARFGLGLALVPDPATADAVEPAVRPTASLPERKPTHNAVSEALRATLVRRFHEEVLGVEATKVRATAIETIEAARAAGVELAIRHDGRVVHRVGGERAEDEVRALVAALTERRRLCGLSAKDVAERSLVGRTTIEFFEADYRAREIELGVMLRYIEVVGHDLGRA